MAGLKKPVPSVWSKMSMIAPASSGPTDSMKRMLATTIIHTTSGTSKARIPGAREFISVVMKLIPPRRKATNSSPTPITHRVLPSGVRLYVSFAESGG